MLRRIVWFVIIIPLAVLLVVFAVANREAVTLSLDPISAEPALALRMPLYMLIFLTLIIGVAIGGFASWLAQGKWRRQARASRDEAARWRVRAEAAGTGDGGRALPGPKRAA
ncbi:MAG: lipopolysaccharide assembly protein LapA domain-containing protein [Flavobacteriaceae bacterium]